MTSVETFWRQVAYKEVLDYWKHKHDYFSGTALHKAFPRYTHQKNHLGGMAIDGVGLPAGKQFPVQKRSISAVGKVGISKK